MLSASHTGVTGRSRHDELPAHGDLWSPPISAPQDRSSEIRRCLILVFLAYLLVVPLAAQAGQPWPAWWQREATCIHLHESVDWHKRTDWLGRPSPDHGGMQIDVGTWRSFAPRGYPTDPADASPAQQLAVAYRIWLANGHSFGGRQWPNSSKACGLR